jgi:hypothetical protein
MKSNSKWLKIKMTQQERLSAVLVWAIVPCRQPVAISSTFRNN